ncbi:hypothetical protein DM02DRAFT_676378 [Periconia macrospinosa]|uniref:Uncharacterized protein n=1 Tax=Periconia macrospinosa TaxID=97972 RepID=A0A2V1DAH2_9PLEO|nr:hypothetical protein DM02DRAFT_676378 [Periconia macrospinosa]
MSNDRRPGKLDSRATSANARHTAHEEDSSSVNAREQNLQQYLKAHSNSSNDCAWLYELLSSAAISAEKVDPIYHVKLHYQDRGDPAATTTKDFRSGNFALLDLENCLASTHLRAVILCHRDSSRVDPKIVNLLWTTFRIDVSFMRHHFDYKNFRYEKGCPKMIRSRLEEESGLVEDYWTFGGRWNPIRLPSETQASILRLSVDSECLSICHRDSVVIALVRSHSVYQIPSSPRKEHSQRDNGSFPCSVDLYTATADTSSTSYEFLSDPSEFSRRIVHFYARFLILRCYEDYALRHDPQPIELGESDRAGPQDNPYIEAMHRRQLELVKLKQDLTGYLGPLACDHKSIPNSKGSNLAENSYQQKLQGLLTDVEMLLSLYEQAMKIYEWHIHGSDSNYRGELASEQLEEARESKATAISLGKLSNMAFLYLPLNFVCAMLAMNLAIFGQGKVPVWVFFLLVVLFSLLTYLPVLFKLDQQRVRLNKVAYHLAWRSPPAAFWFLAFTFTHNHAQNFEILNSGLAQIFLGYNGPRTKGWTNGRNDSNFETATCGSKAFWKGKVQNIFLAVKGLDSNAEPTELVV